MFDVLLLMQSFGTVSVGIRDMIEQGTNGRIKLEHQDELPYAALQYIQRNPDRYDTTIFFMDEEEYLLWDQGIDLTETGIIEPRPLALWGIFPAACTTIFTLDPEIRTIADMAGHSYHPNRTPSVIQIVTELMLGAAGITDDVTLVRSAKNSTIALGDREVDTAGSGIIFQKALTPDANQLAALTKSLFIVDIPEDLMIKARNENPAWGSAGLLQPMKLNPGDLAESVGAGYNLVREPITCVGGISVVLFTSPNADEEVIYQMVKAMLDNRDLADEKFPFMSATWKERVGHAFLPQDTYHPGARRAYEEAGVSYGIEGLREWERQNR